MPRAAPRRGAAAVFPFPVALVVVAGAGALGAAAFFCAAFLRAATILIFSTWPSTFSKPAFILASSVSDRDLSMEAISFVAPAFISARASKPGLAVGETTGAA